MSDLADLLAKAEPRGPTALRSQAGGAALALALHCMMVKEGWVVLDPSGRQRPGFAPLPDWNTAGDNVWGFEYSRTGAALKFRLQCALQAATRRMFIHASEVDSKGEPLKDNIQIMGLQVDNYVPSGDKCSSSKSWDVVIANERTLADMFSEFVANPLWRLCEKTADGAAAGGSSTAGGALAAYLPSAAAQLLNRPTALAAAAGFTAAVAVGVLLWTRSRSAGASH